MKPSLILLAALLAHAVPALAASGHGLAAVQSSTVSLPAPIYVVTARETFAGISAITAEAVPVRSRSGTNLILARTDALSVDRLARYVHEREGRCGGFFAFGTRAEAEAFLANDRSAEAIARIMAYTIDNQATVNPWLPQVQAANILATITSLSNFHNRYYSSTTGRSAALWIHDQWQSLAAGRSDVEVALFEACSDCSTQPSVILRINGTDLANEVVVVGGHLDSVNGTASNPATARSPGADDDASGIATMTEIIRIALASGWKPRRTVEFQAYAAEEVGLNGSEAIASQYSSQGINVVGMLQLDMTNYRTTAPHAMQIISDNSNATLLTHFRALFDAYLAPMGMTRRNVNCGYACSDHSSWTAAGYPAGMEFEAGRIPTSPSDMADFPYIHTINDSLAYMNNSAEHSVPFAQFGLAFIGEMGKTFDPNAPLLKNGFEGNRIGGPQWVSVADSK